MFYLFARSLVERELSIKLSTTPANFDVRKLKIKVNKVAKIAKVYFDHVAGHDDSITSDHFSE